MMGEEGMSALVGKTIAKAWISPDHTIIAFDLDDGTRQAFYTDGDCCSQSWIEHVENASLLPGGKVVAADVPTWQTEPTSFTEDEASYAAREYEGGDCIKVYGVRLTIEGRGTFAFEFRNASNGYYGGSIEPLGQGYKSPQLGELTELSEDF